MADDPTMGITGWFLGYDPGGRQGNGVAAIKVVAGVVRSPLYCTKRNAVEALQWLENVGDSMVPILGIGIDTLTYWGCGDSGRREADFWLRNEYKCVHGSVQSPSRLMGAMLIPGMLVLRRLRKGNEHLYVTETHPKVLFHALTDMTKTYKSVNLDQRNLWLAKITGMDSSACCCSDNHQWDALISAWAAYRGYVSAQRQSGWTNLVKVKKQDELNLEFPAGCVEYRWPDEETINQALPALRLLGSE